MVADALNPGPELYVEVRAAFIRRGSTFNAWCKAAGVNPTNAKACLVGAWNGPKGKALRAHIVEASDMSFPSPAKPDNQSSPDWVETTEAEEFFYWGC